MNSTDQYKIPYMMNHLAIYLPIAVAFILVYFSTLSWIVGTWSTYQGSHGPVILAISLYMIWTKRESFRAMDVSANLPFGIVLTVGGCLLLIAGRLSSLLLLQYLSIVVTLIGVVLLIWGTNYLKALWYPIVYLIFMFPIFSEVLDIFSIHLQNVAAWIAYHILIIAGITVYRHGQFIELPSIVLEVARECNGINHIMALVSLAIPLAYWTQRSWAKKMILIVSAFFLGVVANGLRVAIIGFFAVYKPGGPLHGPYDLFYVSFIFFFGMFFLVVLSSVMAGKRTKGSGKEKPILSEYPARDYSPRQVFPLVFGVAIFLLTGSYLFFLKPEPVYLARPIEEFPYKVGNWTGSDVKFTEYPFIYFLADNEIKRIYRDNEGHEITLYIGYFASQGQEKEIVHYRFDPLQMNAKEIPLNTESGITNINMSIPDKTNGKRSIYFWYYINGKVMTNRYSAKIATIIDAFLHRRTNAAIVVIAVDGVDKEKFDIEFIKDAFPVIQTYLRS